MNLLKNIDISYGHALIGSSSSTDVNTAILDMAGWDGVLFIVPMSASSNTAVATLTVESNTANSDSGMTAITGAVATKTDAGGSALVGGCLVVDVYRPLKRYVQGVITSGTAAVTFDAAISIRYRGRKAPVVQGATILASTQVVGS